MSNQTLKILTRERDRGWRISYKDYFGGKRTLKNQTKPRASDIELSAVCSSDIEHVCVVSLHDLHLQKSGPLLCSAMVAGVRIRQSSTELLVRLGKTKHSTIRTAPIINPTRAESPPTDF